MRYDNIEDAQQAITAYKGGKPKSEEKFANWCRCSLGISPAIMEELWTWYNNQNNGVPMDVPQNIHNQYSTMDEVKLGMIFKL